MRHTQWPKRGRISLSVCINSQELAQNRNSFKPVFRLIFAFIPATPHEGWMG
jgi:hypothetical protein